MNVVFITSFKESVDDTLFIYANMVLKVILTENVYSNAEIWDYRLKSHGKYLVLDPGSKQAKHFFVLWPSAALISAVPTQKQLPT